VELVVSAYLIWRSKTLYNQTWFDMTMCADYLFVPITAIPFMIAMKDERNYDYILKWLFWFIFIVQIVIFIQGVVQLGTGHILFKGMSETGNLKVRNNRVRVRWASFNFIALAYNFQKILNKDFKEIKKDHCVFLLIISSINLILFCQTRMLIIAVIMMYFFMYVNVKKLKKWQIVCLIAAIAAVAFSSGAIAKILNSFSIDGANGGSTSVRLIEVEYYFNSFIDHPITGLGLFRCDSSRPRLYMLYSGTTNGIGTPTDVGLLGLAFETGLLGVGVFSILLFRGIYIIKKCKNSRYRLLLIGIIAYVVCTLPTLIITNIGRIDTIPLCIAVFESVYYRYITFGESNK
jgi:hypothetical protein